MKTIELSGKLKFEDDSEFTRIILIQENGFRIDLISRVKEAIESWGVSGNINYWINDKPITKDQSIERFLKRLYGDIEAGYEDEYWSYSTLTGSGVEHNTEFTIGGHNLLNEFMEHEGKYLIIEINFKD